MAHLLDRKFLIVVGKGGVGKTTVSAALGLAGARRGKRTLICMTNVKERLSHMLDVPPIGSEIVNVAPNLDVVNMDPKVALEEYGLMILKVRALYKAVFENRVVRNFLRGTPGIEAWSMLGKAFFHVSPPSGAPDYDLVVLDAPATGHGLEMLRVPRVIHDVAPPGLLRKEADRALEMFRDPRQAGAVLVTLPEDMPANETIELHNALVSELQMSIGALVVNRKLPYLFQLSEAQALMDLPAKLGADSPAATLARAGRARVLREHVQRDSLAKLEAAIKAQRIELPHLFAPDWTRAHVDSLSRAFA
ncbi:MAG: ArsA family ATPase [Sandaracinaceae bacterium]|jgi:anion-transporting  ArsA/GET3 family ATPase|nr:ArsA family ATPase [Sandaracinaceae bacterium]MBP7680585.1 ArsA family ATPase [Deltaproteobacteria bacterium]MBK6811589.1 ArsA family ATPase [Sandaracinaceae bacterium]MBK7776006.1 ArsA family ATPase [Sandaracinaceae bacterium]MBK8407919.1 ArsA family ATPase [Sandaracinaceae bacterium]